MRAKLEELIKKTARQLQPVRQQGILLEAALKDAEAQYSALRGRMEGLQEALLAILNDPDDDEEVKRQPSAAAAEDESHAEV